MRHLLPLLTHFAHEQEKFFFAVKLSHLNFKKSGIRLSKAHQPDAKWKGTKL